ncbi:Protein CBG26554 [Caenorhabditis briggsae]|uniref:Protein CBG26554 n=1 Tax=Caenorhabditis briggsae TaxID=6238 RepID=B6IM22_CAEBR|nr:Protein CBG26554 [Caenorhabditis briggsae]CAS00952.1 Protein CBG26554 [Caenorhabditis briggsae]
MEDLRELIEQNEGVAKESAAHDEKGNARIPEPIGMMNCCSTIASWKADFSSWVSLVFSEESEKKIDGSAVLRFAFGMPLKKYLELGEVHFSRLQSEARKIVEIYQAERYNRLF